MFVSEYVAFSEREVPRGRRIPGNRVKVCACVSAVPCPAVDIQETSMFGMNDAQDVSFPGNIFELSRNWVCKVCFPFR